MTPSGSCWRPSTPTASSIGRRGMRSLWSAHYDVFAPNSTAPAFSIREGNPLAKILDGLLDSVPVVSLFSGYLFHPRYLASRAQAAAPVFRLTKQSAFFEGR